MGQTHIEGMRDAARGLVLADSHGQRILESHNRCRQLGLSEDLAPDFSRVARGDLDVALERSRCLLSHAVPHMETLYQQIVNTRNMVILTDADGLILHSCGDDDFLRRAEQVALRRGAVWSERDKGTNAIGTALIVGEPTVVHADEHFLRANHFLTCSCAPVLDPYGAIAGALDISGDHRSHHRHTLALARMSSQMIENHLFRDTFADAVCVRFHARPEFLGTLMEGIAAFTPEGRFLSANASGQFQLGLPLPALRGRDFAALFDAPLKSLIDRSRSAAPGPLFCCMHNGVAVYLRIDFDAPRLFPVPAARTRAEEAPGARAAPASHLRYLDTGDAQIRRVVGKVNRVLGKDISVLVLGETGTGKELLARAIHGDSPRRDGPFVAINCASIPEGLIESELFGYAEGAFTGGRKRGHAGRILGANGGTLFLDEIGDMPAALQPRLLRVLEERRITPLGSDKSVPLDIALVCATHRDLQAMIDAGQFREDLYYRINGLVVRLPSLRERTDLEAVIHRLLLRERAAGVTIDPEVMRFFREYAWPGNVRQLVNLLRTAVQMLDAGRVIRREHLPDDVFAAPAPAARPTATRQAPTATRLNDLEWHAIREALDGNDGNVSAAARALGISRNTIYRRLASQGRGRGENA
ncbi:MAG TPA: sigma-54-dependent Fis family transcriptional regulator [Burkholderiaceae bacterium]|nr:sigma-54-dependent Fis family transcriptional regulator [Burkholderiaceae bacterium]